MNFPMKRFRLAILIIILMILAGVAAYFFIPNARDPGQVEVHAVAEPPVVAEVIKAAASDRVIELDGKNAAITFTAAKSLGGKILTVTGGWSGKFSSRGKGVAVVDPLTRELRQIRGEIEIASLWSEHDLLTKNLLGCGFFNVKEYPTATFITTRIDPAKGGLGGATHRVQGNFQLNGIEKSLTAPARIEVTLGGLRVEAHFAINRRDFGVLFRDNHAFPILDDGNILPWVALNITVEAGEITALATPGRAADSLKGKPEPAGELPKTCHDVIPLSQVGFDVVLVPGDPVAGIGPFYLGRTEVTWDEFMPWVMCKDLPEEKQAEQRALKQRPSAPYATVDRGFGFAHRPAIGMSRLAAERYCEWLSKQTGHKYRLPTEKEWVHAFELGGGNAHGAPSEEEANASAVWFGNSKPPSLKWNSTLPAGSKIPNKLGVFDMIGNASEWVTDTGEDRVVRGGDFLSPVAALGGAGRELQDDEVWNANYPGLPGDPKSIWWFTDAPGVGFRLLREPD